MSESYRIFDRRRVRARRARALAQGRDALYLFAEGAAGLGEKLRDVNRAFQDALLIGPGLDASVFRAPPQRLTRAETDVAFDEEALPFRDGAFDLILANLTLHWVNDLPGALVQMRRILRPDGLLLAVMFGGETLPELRMSLLEAEAEVEGGASPRVSPFVDVRDGGNLLSRAGFALPVADTETVTVTFDDPLKLMKDLREMGETNALLERRKRFTRKATLMRAAAIYGDAFSDAEGRVIATFEFLYLTGWAPGPGQPQPLKPGAGKVSLKDVL